MFLKKSFVLVLGLGLSAAYADGGHPGHDHDDHDQHGGHGHDGDGHHGDHDHDHDHDHDGHHGHEPSDGDWVTLGALLGSLAVSSTAEASDDHKEILERSDAIVEQVLNQELPDSFYSGFRTQKEYQDLENFEIDLVLLQTLSNL
jgi:hypothetical protein